MENPVVMFCRMAGVPLPESPKTLIFESDEDHVYVALIPGREWVCLKSYLLGREKLGVEVRLVALENGDHVLCARGEELREIQPDFPVTLEQMALEMQYEDYPYGIVRLFQQASGLHDVFRFVAMTDMVVT